MRYFGSAERQIVPPSPHEGGQWAEVAGVLILPVLVCRNDLLGSGQCKSLGFAVEPLFPDTIV